MDHQASLTAIRNKIPFQYRAQSRWSATDTETAKRLYMAGKSYTEIGLEIGKTKGQVAGRLNRLNILRTRRVVRPPVERIRLAVTAPVKMIKVVGNPPKPKRVRLRVIDSDTAVTFAELERHMCRWPIGDPKLPDFRFCGCNRVSDRTPYCSEHSTLAGRRYEKEAQTQK